MEGICNTAGTALNTYWNSTLVERHHHARYRYDA